MDKSAPTILKEWFDDLSDVQKLEVLKFVYGSVFTRKTFTEGIYCGPPPDMIKKGGLFTGPAPSSTGDSSVCPTCKRPW